MSPAQLGRTSGRSAAVDMLGRTCGSWVVIARQPHVKSQNGIRWLARHSCGGEHALPGFVLRREPPLTCPTCNPKRSALTAIRMTGRDRWWERAQEERGDRKRKKRLR